MYKLNPRQILLSVLLSLGAAIVSAGLLILGSNRNDFHDFVGGIIIYIYAIYAIAIAVTFTCSFTANLLIHSLAARYKRALLITVFVVAVTFPIVLFPLLDHIFSR